MSFFQKNREQQIHCNDDRGDNLSERGGGRGDGEEHQRTTTALQGDPSPLSAKAPLPRRRSSRLSQYSGDGRHVVEPPFAIAAFNVKRFGVSKVSDRTVAEILVKIICNFDVILIQEVVDVSGTAVTTLLLEVNNSVKDGEKYDVLVSPRVGRSTQKEQYALFYRFNKLQILDSQMYVDDGDVFSRDPFLVSVKADTVLPKVQHFTMVCIHTQPKCANAEIDQLFTVCQYVKNSLLAENIVILGDLNAGGNYVSSHDWTENRLREPNFTWLIPDHMDTTATSTLAAYDRIVVSGQNLIDSVVPGSAQVFRYDEHFKISQETLLKVSDHYPVCFKLVSSIHPHLQKYIKHKLALTVVDTRFPAIEPNQFVREFKLTKFKAETLHQIDGDMKLIEIRSQKLSDLSDVVSNLEKVRRKYRHVVSYSMLASIRHQIEEGFTVYPGSFLSKETSGKFVIVLRIDLHDKKLSCTVETSA